MDHLNSVLIEGCLAADPMVATSEHGVSSAKFTIGVRRWFAQDGEKKYETSYFDIECWNKTATLALECLTKGRGVRVVGRLKQKEWEQIEADGNSTYHSKVYVVAEVVEFKPKFDRLPSAVEAFLIS